MGFKPLELLEKKYEIIESEPIDSGDFGKIYRLNDGNVVKILYDTCSGRLYKGKQAQFDIYREGKNQNFANTMGLNFAKVEGIYAIKGSETGFYFPGLVMEDLGDVTLDSLEGAVLQEANRQLEEQKNLAKEAGVIFQDRHGRNVLWKDGKVRMCDAGKLRVDSCVC